MRYEISRMNEVSPGLRVGPGALTDNDLLGAARDFKKNIASRYKLLSEGDLRSLPEDRFAVAGKIDGQLHFLWLDAEGAFLFNPAGRVIAGLPLLAEAAKAFGKGPLLLAGELYCSGPRSRVYEVTSALGADGAEKASRLCFGAFAVLREGGEERRWSFEQSQEFLRGRLPASGSLHFIEQQSLDRAGMGKLYNSFVVDAAQEGLVACPAGSPMIYKIKPRHSVDVAIIGYTERPDEPGSVRVLLCAMMRPDGAFQVFSKVGTGFDDDQRRELFRLLSPHAVASDYQEADRNHTLFTLVEPRHVIEMVFHDLLTENSAGRPMSTAVLRYQAGSGYQAQLPEAFVAPLGPVFKRFRDDKSVCPDDLRLTQLRDFVDLDNLEKPARALELSASAILQREVYTKVTKGLTAVRKLISWETRKSDLDEAYPPFVFCYVDYSPGRATPLARKVRIARSRAELDAIFARFRDEEIKKGWVLTPPS
ncbi:MAG: hypothetical protein RL095_3160 [Verrucomicrobiota bacterium]|jgi:ATP-dependent DNA ligase